jgi:hypothetical protein
MQNTSFPYFPDFSPSDLSNSNNINDLSKSHMEVPPGKKNFTSRTRNDEEEKNIFSRSKLV